MEQVEHMRKEGWEPDRDRTPGSERQNPRQSTPKPVGMLPGEDRKNPAPGKSGLEEQSQAGTGC
jgi:hypothetical protein